mmetsp:Transcript_34721/g.98383  ORF Transcript_34721/g.98383 Transcript_34721/m.98383 type:complete len:212 (-) Transcript_34721:109-744(-)|eukprot:CAMPEP_0117682342 /NCGR_PEP_ID=MMETSP0804-20121206/19593_1 /TAXON_ID=1074897 /ORGANISM="Tetraselmis astigmatica, Strain CCMP880" /LENGTH=211 /DNA_ID=CAMNT_0005492417 /DNA_START=108 /DNA_END=743 /DNA_ORIENTATION=-
MMSSGIALCSGASPLASVGNNAELRTSKLQPSVALVPHPSRNGRPAGRTSHVANAGRYSPVHKKYVSFTREELEEKYLQEWLFTTGMDGSTERPMTVWSVIWFIPMWIWFCVIPDPIRFLMFLAWQPMHPLWIAAYRRTILAGAILDAFLCKLKGSPQTFSTTEVLRRYHGKVSIWRKLYYRVLLLTGAPLKKLDEDAKLIDPMYGQLIMN